MKRLPVFNYKFYNNSSNGSCDVYIDGAIVDATTEAVYKEWFSDETVKSFKGIRDQIESSGASEINIYINSVGGQVTEAMAIHDYLVNLKQKGKKVKCFGRGIIASSATYILMADDDSTISENSWFMIHNVSGGIYGDVDEIENYAATIRKFNDTVTNFYSKRTGMTADEIGNMMAKETFMTGTEAVNNKFVKNLEAEQNFTNSINPDQWLFNNQSVLQAYNSFTKPHNNMEIKTIANQIKDALMNSLKEAGILKDENKQLCETLTNALDKALEPMNTGIPAMIQDAVDKININDKVAEALKNAGFIKSEEVDTKITDQLKDVTDRITDVEEKIANGAGSAGHNGGKDGPETIENSKHATWQ